MQNLLIILGPVHTEVLKRGISVKKVRELLESVLSTAFWNTATESKGSAFLDACKKSAFKWECSCHLYRLAFVNIQQDLPIVTSIAFLPQMVSAKLFI